MSSKRGLPPRAGAGSPGTPQAPLTPSFPLFPGVPSPVRPHPANPLQLPDFSGAIRSFTTEWTGMLQVGLGALALLAGGSILILSTSAGRQGARAGLAAAGPWGKIASVVL